MKKNGKNLADIEEAEPEPSLGNGGLGDWQHVSLDSIATWDFRRRYQSELPLRSVQAGIQGSFAEC